MKLGLLAVALAIAGVGAVQAQDVTSEKGKLSYAFGYDLGRSLSERKMDVDMATLERAIQDGLAHRNPAIPAEQMEQVLQGMHQKLLAQAKADFDKASTDNKTASDKFMARYRARAFVKSLPDGVMYRVIEEGDGPLPRADGQVRILYKASVPSGQVFATNDGGDKGGGLPTTVTIGQSPLVGIKRILPMMKQGAHWEVVLPPELAYGSGPESPIGPNQAVMFDIKVVEVLK